ncbi:MAG: glutamine synthetase family protein [Solirubrobacteraceae bacterium]
MSSGIAEPSGAGPAAPRLPSGASVTQAIELLSAAGVRTARVSHCDLYGKCRSKDLPLDRLALAAAGLGFCLISMVESIHGEPLYLPSFAGDSEFPDMHSRIDLGTGRVLPWEPDVAWFLADLFEDRGLSPRGALRRAVAELQGLGLSAALAPELEFYLLERQGATAVRYGPDTGLAYVNGHRVDPRGAFKRIYGALRDLGLDVTTAHHEFSPGQWEVNLHHGEALEAADRAFMLKHAVRELAVVEGLDASFMAKPFMDAEGSSYHVHVSLARDGENAFAATEGGGVSDECLGFLAGVLAHADGLTALGAPTVNSYRRLVPETMAPTRADWGHDHRFAYIRVPRDRGPGTRLELRAPDASANPYLIHCGILVAGLDGLRRGLRPPPPRTAGAESEGRRLPITLDRALDALEADEVLGEGLGGELVRTFAALKRSEVERERRHVSDWDWSEYAFHS